MTRTRTPPDPQTRRTHGMKEEEENHWSRFLGAWRRRVGRRKSVPEENPAEREDPTLRDALLQAIHDLEESYESCGRTGAVRTGFADLDRLTGGSRPGELMVVASVSGTGKTVMAVNVALHAGLSGAASVTMFSPENSRRELTQQILCSQAGVPLNRVRSGGLSPSDDFPRLQDAAERLAGLSLRVEDAPQLTVAGFRRRLAELSRGDQVPLVILDHFQLLLEHGGDGAEAARVARELKRMAREFGIVLLVMAQLDRPRRRDGRPGVADLAACGAVERHADVLALLWRQDFGADPIEDYDADFARASLILAKNRTGPLGEVPLLFRKDVPRFENRALEGQGHRAG